MLCLLKRFVKKPELDTNKVRRYWNLCDRALLLMCASKRLSHPSRRFQTSVSSFSHRVRTVVPSSRRHAQTLRSPCAPSPPNIVPSSLHHVAPEHSSPLHHIASKLSSHRVQRSFREHAETFWYRLPRTASDLFPARFRNSRTRCPPLHHIALKLFFFSYQRVASKLWHLFRRVTKTLRPLVHGAPKLLSHHVQITYSLYRVTLELLFPFPRVAIELFLSSSRHSN
jgi:hypothetical protein